MANMKSKIFALLGVCLVLGAGYLYLSSLKEERDSALKSVGILSAAVTAQNETIAMLREDRGQIDTLMKEWRLTREGIATERQSKREATKEAHNSDASFSDWASSHLPPSVQSGGLLGKTGDSGPAATCSIGSSKCMDDAYAISRLEGQEQP